MDNKDSNNILGIVGLIVSLFFSGLIGLILCISAIRKTDEIDSTGRTCAIFGIIVGIIKTLFIAFIIIVIMLAAFYSSDNYIPDPCNSAYGCVCDGDMCKCDYTDEDGNTDVIECPNGELYGGSEDMDYDYSETDNGEYDY